MNDKYKGTRYNFFIGTKPILINPSQPEDFTFHELNKKDSLLCKHIMLKEDEKIVRCETKSSKEIGMSWLVKLDTKRDRKSVV